MKIHRNIASMILLIFIMALAVTSGIYASRHDVSVRIKDLVTIQGNNTNQLIGYSLVTGLGGTGDRTKTPSSAMIGNMFAKLGIPLPDKDIERLQTKNSAVVMVTAALPASFRSGDTIDVTVSSMGDARSLEGGVLLLASLKGPDGNVYATAQGPLVVGTDGDSGRGGQKKKVVGMIPSGGLICRSMDANLVRDGKITLVIRQPDFTTATRIAEAINHKFMGKARAEGDKFVVVEVGESYEDPADFMAKIGGLTIVPDTVAKVVVNERTGTVVMGAHVKILPVVISHGNLTLKVSRGKGVSQESSQTTASKGAGVSMEGGKKEIVGEWTDTPAQGNPPQVSMQGSPGMGGNYGETTPPGKRLIQLGGDATVRDVIDVLNYLDIPPRDLITILKTLKKAGALQAELEVI